MTGRYRLRAERDAHGERLLKPGGIGEWLFIIACVGLSWLGFGLIFDDPKGDGSNIFFGLLIAISCLGAAVQLACSRPTICLDAEGMTLTQFGRSHRYPWGGAIDWLSLVRGKGGNYPHVVFKASGSFFGHTLFANHGMSSSALLGLLETYRQAAGRNVAY